jgi:glycine dehydrogenase
MTNKIDSREAFVDRHIAPTQAEIDAMLKYINASSMDELIDQTIPEQIRDRKEMNLPPAIDEYNFLRDFKKMASQNELWKSFIGMGYYGCIVPGVIQRNILENPGWYTAYTPYQAEIAQGRLEALINYQTLITDLTGMEIANASLLDEGTAAAEAMAMFFHSRKGAQKNANVFLVDKNILPQTLAILETRAEPIQVEIKLTDFNEDNWSSDNAYGLIVQYPDGNGAINGYSDLIAKAKANGLKIAFAADLMSLVLLKSPGEMGADCVVGNTQRFGVPMGYGGPHAAYFATFEEYKRKIPGRIIGASLDSNNGKAYRMALQTREQHIRRAKATSNICTAQVLLAVMAGMYAVYHGPDGLKKIAQRIHSLTSILNKAIQDLGLTQMNQHFFDTLKVKIENLDSFKSIADEMKLNFRYFSDGYVGISLDETTQIDDVEEILSVFCKYQGKDCNCVGLSVTFDPSLYNWPTEYHRNTAFLEHEVFNIYHAEHEMLRYMKFLENKDLSLVHSMISLGSCTMKLNATTEMVPVTWPEWGGLHPFTPIGQTSGYQELFKNLEDWLAEITGFSKVSLQPNSGAQGEYAGLMVIKAFHENNDEGHRDVTLIPSSAHGTNPASAVMAGQKVVVVACDEKGNIDVDDLKAKAEQYKDNLASLMATYPSTHGVFEEEIMNVCKIMHSYGAQVYMDGANLNAQLGYTSPGFIGADVCHLNLHKTFCIPHGGGGPGMGPIGVASHLAPFLPGNPVIKMGGENGISSISSAPWGSASILPISYAYIAMMGAEGLKKATAVAILNANYIKERLKDNYPILYSGKNGRNAHEVIIDCRDFKQIGIEVIDIAKRLMDYGFHAPTVSFPVPGTMMIEPTESENKGELDRFCDALIQIKKEIDEIATGEADPTNNVILNSPHTQEVALQDEWPFPYTRSKAVYPLDFVKSRKFWPAVSRINDAFGDRNLHCTCSPMEDYMTIEE